MKGNCYYCTKEMESNQLKKCSRCKLPRYCSKECQTAAWKAGHKFTCTSRPASVEDDGTGKPRDVPWTVEWAGEIIEKKLSRWIQAWRNVLHFYNLHALDLANHPPSRNSTHCMAITVHINFRFDAPTTGDRLREFKAAKAEVAAIADLKKAYPNITNLDSYDGREQADRLRYVVIVAADRGKYRGEMIRVRSVQYTDGSAASFRAMDKAECAKLAREWQEVILDLLLHKKPEDCPARLVPITPMPSQSRT